MNSEPIQKPVLFSHEGWRVLAMLDEPQARALTASVLHDEIQREKTFRDNWRTLSAKIRFDDSLLLLKISRARNARKWERLLTVFRGSDAGRSFQQLSIMQQLGLQAPEPILVGERLRCKMVLDSFLVYRFVEGRPATAEDAGKVLDALLSLHEKGFVRGDPQLANFVLTEGRVTFIDFRLKRVRFLSALRKNRELIRFEKSCASDTRVIPRHLRASFWYRLAAWVEYVGSTARSLKKEARKRRKGRRGPSKP